MNCHANKDKAFFCHLNHSCFGWEYFVPPLPGTACANTLEKHATGVNLLEVLRWGMGTKAIHVVLWKKQY